MKDDNIVEAKPVTPKPEAPKQEVKQPEKKGESKYNPSTEADKFGKGLDALNNYVNSLAASNSPINVRLTFAQRELERAISNLKMVK